jgi:hypothetical protein
LLEEFQRANGVGGAADGWIDGGGLAAQPISENGAPIGPVNVVVDAGAKVQEARADGSPSDGYTPLGAGSDGSYVVTDPGESSEAVRAANPPPEDDVYVNVEVKVQKDQADGPPSDDRASDAASGDGAYKGTYPGEYSGAGHVVRLPPTAVCSMELRMTVVLAKTLWVTLTQWLDRWAAVLVSK